jgi:hypothetical protein
VLAIVLSKTAQAFEYVEILNTRDLQCRANQLFPPPSPAAMINLGNTVNGLRFRYGYSALELSKAAVRLTELSSQEVSKGTTDEPPSDQADSSSPSLPAALYSTARSTAPHRPFDPRQDEEINSPLASYLCESCRNIKRTSDRAIPACGIRVRFAKDCNYTSV